MNRIPEIKGIFMQDIICSLVNTRIKDAQVQKSFMNDNILTEIRLAELNLRKKYCVVSVTKIFDGISGPRNRLKTWPDEIETNMIFCRFNDVLKQQRVN